MMRTRASCPTLLDPSSMYEEIDIITLAQGVCESEQGEEGGDVLLPDPPFMPTSNREHPTGQAGSNAVLLLAHEELKEINRALHLPVEPAKRAVVARGITIGHLVGTIGLSARVAGRHEEYRKDYPRSIHGSSSAERSNAERARRLKKS